MMKSVQHPEMFWGTDDEKIELLFSFNVYSLGFFVSEAWRKQQDGLLVEGDLLYLRYYSGLSGVFVFFL